MHSKARAIACAASSTPRSTREVIFVRGTTEAINLVAQSYARSALRPGRRDPDHRARASREHRARGSWSASRPAHRSKSRRSTGAASFEFDEFEKLLSPRTKLVGRRARLQCARHHPAGQAHHRRGTCARRARAGRWRAGRAARARRHARAGLRLLRLLQPQALRPDRHRRALRTRSAARTRCPPGKAAAT